MTVSDHVCNWGTLLDAKNKMIVDFQQSVLNFVLIQFRLFISPPPNPTRTGSQQAEQREQQAYRRVRDQTARGLLPCFRTAYEGTGGHRRILQLQFRGCGGGECGQSRRWLASRYSLASSAVHVPIGTKGGVLQATTSQEYQVVAKNNDGAASPKQPSTKESGFTFQSEQKDEVERRPTCRNTKR